MVGGTSPDPTAPGSTVPRRQLGRYLRDARGRARTSVRAAAEALEWSETKIWRIETGQTAMRSLDVEAMCRVYATPAPLTEALVGLAKQAKERGWWHAYGDVIPAWFDPYIGVQEAAADLRQYQSELVPGLLQTAEYARAVIARMPTSTRSRSIAGSICACSGRRSSPDRSCLRTSPSCSTSRSSSALSAARG